METSQDYQVLLYYKYVTIDDPETFAEEHLQFCKDLGLKGRILVAKEGLNGTVSGTIEQTNQYMEALHQDPRFHDMTFKIDASDKHAFKKMHVRPRQEIVSLRHEEINPAEQTGDYLSPNEFYNEMKRDDAIILDTRNDYEYDLGHFRGAIRPDIEAFRDLPQWLDDHQDMIEGKRILMYCTGGIRCEKLSAWMLKEGYDDIGQLHGGIVSYGKDPEVQGAMWDGRCYVFDTRISVPINQTEHVVVGEDYFDGKPCERYVNCANPSCNKQILCSEENEYKYMRSCTHECRTSSDNLYVKEHQLTDEAIQARMEAIQEEEKAQAVR